MPDMLTRWPRAYLSRHPVSGFAVLAQWLRRRPHEDDFRLFDAVRELPGLVIDVGAHRGQSAVSILRRTHRLKVWSFEPNRALRFSLLALRVLHPVRFRYRMAAVGAEAGVATLLIPGSGGSGLSPQAALNPDEYRKAPAVERLAAAGLDAGDPAVFRRRRVNVTTLDGFAACPDVLKIDAEGSEYAVLRGAEHTLRRHRPALLIEVNDTHVWMPWLEEMGYRFHRYDAADGTLHALLRPEDSLNLVGLHPDSRSPVSAAFSERIVGA